MESWKCHGSDVITKVFRTWRRHNPTIILLDSSEPRDSPKDSQGTSKRRETGVWGGIYHLDEQWRQPGCLGYIGDLWLMQKQVTYGWWFRNPARKTSWGNGSSSHYLQGLNIQPVVGNGISAINSMTICRYISWLYPCLSWKVLGCCHRFTPMTATVFSDPIWASYPDHQLDGVSKIWSEQWKKNQSCLGSWKSIRCFSFVAQVVFRMVSPRRAKDLFQRAQRAWKATKSEDSGRGSWVVLRQSAGVGKSFYECLFNLRIHRIIYWPLVRGGISFVVFVLLSWKVQFFLHQDINVSLSHCLFEVKRESCRINVRSMPHFLRPLQSTSISSKSCILLEGPGQTQRRTERWTAGNSV